MQRIRECKLLLFSGATMWSEKGDVSYNPIFFRDCIVPGFGFSGILCKSYWGSCDILYTIYVFIYTYIYMCIYIYVLEFFAEPSCFIVTFSAVAAVAKGIAL